MIGLFERIIWYPVKNMPTKAHRIICWIFCLSDISVITITIEISPQLDLHVAVGEKLDWGRGQKWPESLQATGEFCQFWGRFVPCVVIAFARWRIACCNSDTPGRIRSLGCSCNLVTACMFASVQVMKFETYRVYMYILACDFWLCNWWMNF